MLVRVALSTLILGVGSAFALEPGDPARGRTLALQDCADCHAVEKGQTESPADGVASFERIAAEPGMSPLALEIWLTTPHRDMPHLILEANERNDLIAYITSLKQ